MTGVLAALLCSSLNLQVGNQLDACKAAFTAGAIQIGLDAQIKLVERYADKKARTYIGERNLYVGGAAYTIFKTRTITYGFPLRPWVHGVTVHVSEGTQSVGLSWSF